ncbi:hypothetical protein CGLAMM_09875 [Acetobacteraceae bacterium EV16G]|uniref:Lipoprotein n=1 Tax=Sorlinia euscelidii TaxID=3081148 RepID=A0ABU7U449_9PROT
MRKKTVQPCTLLRPSRLVRPGRLSLTLGGLLLLSACSGVWRHNPYALPIARYNAGPDTRAVPSASVEAARQFMDQVGVSQYTSPDWQPGRVREVVLLTFRDDVSAMQKQAFAQRLARLTQDSRRPDGSHPIDMIEIGWEGAQTRTPIGRHFLYILQFRSEGDRHFVMGPPIVTDPQFYDPAYAAFSAFMAGLIVDRTEYGYHPAIVPGIVARSKRAS